MTRLLKVFIHFLCLYFYCTTASAVSEAEVAAKLPALLEAVRNVAAKERSLDVRLFLNKWSPSDLDGVIDGLANHQKLSDESVDTAQILGAFAEVFGLRAVRKLELSTADPSYRQIYAMSELAILKNNRQFAGLCDDLIFAVDGDEMVILTFMESKYGFNNPFNGEQFNRLLLGMRQHGFKADHMSFPLDKIKVLVRGEEKSLQGLTLLQPSRLSIIATRLQPVNISAFITWDFESPRR